MAKKFGWHKSAKGLGTIGAELACLFCATARAPIAYVFGKANMSEDKLFVKLFKSLTPNSLILIDSGFYAFAIFREIRSDVTRHFIIPAAITTRPKMIKTLGPHDYLAEITASNDKNAKMIVRVIYVYRQGFRRKRLVTSLLDNRIYPASEIATVYHVRWSIETFYGEFKNVMNANRWHCQTVDSFEKELACQMIVACLTRLAMSEAAKTLKITPEKLSFSRAFTEIGCFFKKILLNAGMNIGTFEEDYAELVRQCAKHLVTSKPGRRFTRDKQEYRRKSRGLDKGKVGRPRKPFKPVKKIDAEFLKNAKGNAVLMD